MQRIANCFSCIVCVSLSERLKFTLVFGELYQISTNGHRMQKKYAICTHIKLQVQQKLNAVRTSHGKPTKTNAKQAARMPNKYVEWLWTFICMVIVTIGYLIRTYNLNILLSNPFLRKINFAPISPNSGIVFHPKWVSMKPKQV